MAAVIWESQKDILPKLAFIILCKSIRFTIPYMFKSYVSLRTVFDGMFYQLLWELCENLPLWLWSCTFPLWNFLFCFVFFIFCFICCEAMLFCAYKLRFKNIFLVDWLFYHYYISFSVSSNIPSFKVYFVSHMSHDT